MIISLMVVTFAFIWMLLETNYLRLRLIYGKVKPDIYLLPAAKLPLLLPVAKSRRQLSMTMSEWNEYDAEHAYELEQEQIYLV